MSARRVLRKKVILCVGAGGVGKTTVAASVAVAAALQGRDTAVITVDPARRLEDALGLGRLTAHPRPVALAGGEGQGVLHAFALDAKHTFDTLVERFASGPEAARRILDNRLYQEISNGLAGSAEYMAMEKLHHMVTHDHYDTVVVDTPPSAHARDLLGAPNRMLDLLASRAVSFLRAPASMLGGGTGTLARMTLSTLLKGLERWTGMKLLDDLAEFTGAFEHMIEGFAERADQVARLLRSPSTAFVLVTTPEPHTIATTIGFHRELAAEGYPIAGVIANRVLAFPELAEDARAQGLPENLRHRLLANYDDMRKLSRRDERQLATLRRQTRAPLLAAIPLLTELPVSVAALQRFAQYLG